jgi:hypothetical protein
MLTRVTLFSLLVAISLATFARGQENLEHLIARAESAPPGERPVLYIRIARQQADAADKFYQEGNAEAGNAALGNVVTCSQKASGAAAATGKRLKDTEIALRKMAEKFRDVKRSLPFEDQAPVQQAVDSLEKMRTDLLAVMFGKKGKK